MRSSISGGNGIVVCVRMEQAPASKRRVLYSHGVSPQRVNSNYTCGPRHPRQRPELSFGILGMPLRRGFTTTKITVDCTAQYTPVAASLGYVEADRGFCLSVLTRGLKSVFERRGRRRKIGTWAGHKVDGCIGLYR